MSEAPVGVLAEGAGGLALARVIMARLPAEDLTVLSDNAYAPYAQRSARVVADRAPRMAAELAGDGIKLLVVASLQAGEDALDAVATAAGVPTIALDATLVQAAARSDVERIAAIWADGTLRAQPWLKAHRFQRGGVEVVPLPWPGLAQAIEAGRAPDPASLPDVPPDCTVALLCPYAAMTAELFEEPVELRDDHRRARPPAADAHGRARPPPPGRQADAAQLASGARAGLAAGASALELVDGAADGRHGAVDVGRADHQRRLDLEHVVVRAVGRDQHARALRRPP